MAKIKTSKLRELLAKSNVCPICKMEINEENVLYVEGIYKIRGPLISMDGINFRNNTEMDIREIEPIFRETPEEVIVEGCDNCI